jgi:hypothetical protein
MTTGAAIATRFNTYLTPITSVLVTGKLVPDNYMKHHSFLSIYVMNLLNNLQALILITATSTITRGT